MPGIASPAGFGFTPSALVNYASGGDGFLRDRVNATAFRSRYDNIRAGGENNGDSSGLAGAASASNSAFAVNGSGAGGRGAGGRGAAGSRYPTEASSSAEPKSPSGKTLSAEAQAELARLERRDQEVRTHEQAHQNTGGSYAGAPSYQYQAGPDGVQYATGGEVSIDASSVPDDPQATITKMGVVKQAALAPLQPSAQDYKVAATADRRIAEAEAELATGKTKDGKGIESAGAGQDKAAQEKPEQAIAQTISDSTRRGLKAYGRAAALGGQAQTGGGLAIAA